jgi:hypothetical protein
MSPSPPSSQTGSHTPPVSPFSVAATSSLRSPPHGTSTPSSRRVSFDESRESSPPRPRSQSRERLGARLSLASVSTSILEAMRSVSGTSRERHQSKRRGDDHLYPPHHPLGNVDGVVGLDIHEGERSGDGWQEFKKGTVQGYFCSYHRVTKLQGHTHSPSLLPFPLTCLPPYNVTAVLSPGT